jgi:hypothetical protein
MMAAVGEIPEECLSLDVERLITAEGMDSILGPRLFTERDEPSYICSNRAAPEFIAQALKGWLAASGVTRSSSSPALRGRTPTRRAS